MQSAFRGSAVAPLLRNAQARPCNPAQVLLSVVCGFSAFLWNNRKSCRSSVGAPVLQGSCCNNALSRMVNPAHTLFSVVCGFSAFLAEQPQILLLLRCAPVLQGSCCNNALSRMVNPAQVLLSVVYGFSAFLAEQPQVLPLLRWCAGGARKLLYKHAPTCCKSGASFIFRRVRVFRFFTGQAQVLPVFRAN